MVPLTVHGLSDEDVAMPAGSTGSGRPSRPPTSRCPKRRRAESRTAATASTDSGTGGAGRAHRCGVPKPEAPMQPAQRGGRPPVGVSRQAHEGGHQHGPDQGGVDQDGQPRPDAEHLDEADLRRPEGEEGHRHQGGRRGHDPPGAGQAAGHRLLVG